MEDYEKAVFISYAKGGEQEELANQIDQFLQLRGLVIIRDTRDLRYRGSLQAFMERVGRGNCVILVLSDSYLRSASCMFELVEIAENKQFHDRIFPLVLPDATIYDPVERLKYVRYWEEKRDELDAALRSVDQANLKGIREEIDLYDRIRDEIAELTSILRDMNRLRGDTGKDADYLPLYEAIEKRMQQIAVMSKPEEGQLSTSQIEHGLLELWELIPMRAPVLEDRFAGVAKKLRATLEPDGQALSPAQREEQLAEIGQLCLEVIDISFHALCTGQKPPPYDERSPFRGLESFEPEHSDFFFGRETLIPKLLEKIRSYPFLAVLGASGSGKSSLVKAGLLPDLGLNYVILRPGINPLAALEPAKGSPLIVVDQFEELFTLTREEATRQEFVAQLLEAMKQSKVVITMRSDFMGEVAALRALNEEVQNHLENVPPMNLEELRHAMECQAGVVGLQFEPGLSKQILDDIEGEPGAMPLLQHALWELWNRRHGRWLKSQTYEDFGGVKQAITTTAEKVYGAYSPAEQEQMRDIFLRLTRLDESDASRDTRRRVPLRRLISSGTDRSFLELLLDRLANARLIVKTTMEDETYVEVVHEALIQKWDRLRNWIDSKSEFLIWRQVRLAPSLERHKAEERRLQDEEQAAEAKHAHLLDDEEAVEAKRWLVEQHREFSTEERDFVFHSLLWAELIDMASWLPSFGTQEAIFSALEPYWNDPSEEKRKLGVRALSALPSSDGEAKIIQRLQSFVFEDSSLEVASLAAQAICKRGQIEGLVTMLNQEQLPRERERRLIQVLASTRNLPVIGQQVLKGLKRFRRQIQMRAAWLLVQEYRNELAITFAVTFLSGLLGGIVISILTGLSFQVTRLTTGITIDDPLSIFAASIGSTDIMIVLIFGVLATIQVRLVDRKPLSKKDLRPAVRAALIYALLFTLISWTGLLSSFQSPDLLEPVIFRSDFAPAIANGIRELLTTWIFATFLVAVIFRTPLLFEPGHIVERSFFVAFHCSALVLLVYMTMSVLSLVLSVLLNQSDLLSLLDFATERFDSSREYFWGVSAQGVLDYIADGLRVFTYLLGLYFGLQTAFQNPDARKQLSEVS